MTGRLLPRLAGAALLVGGLVFWEDPLMDFRLRHPEFLPRLLFLYGFAPLAGGLLLARGGDLFILRPAFSGTAALLALPWALVWGMLWSRLVALNGPAAPLGWQGLALAEALGLAPALAGLVAGFFSRDRSGAWFTRALGWFFLYESAMNLWLQPGLWFSVSAALGGGLVIAGTFAPPPKER